LYIDADPPVVLDSGTGRDMPPLYDEETLAAWFSALAPKTVYECAAAIDGLYVCRFTAETPATILDRIRRSPPLPAEAAEVLKPSMGMLLWHWQINHLLHLFHRDINLVNNLATRVRKRSHAALHAFKSLIFDDGRSVHDIIRQRSIGGLTVHPNLRGGAALARHLMQQPPAATRSAATETIVANSHRIVVSPATGEVVIYTDDYHAGPLVIDKELAEKLLAVTRNGERPDRHQLPINDVTSK